tara:strand:- start:61 stop:819 length:759 start_codon:yes stop_codon:yes gene_type:complete
MIEIFILSLIQGITEFLPVSSSSHLIIFSKFIDFSEQSLSIDLSLHIGSFIAVLVYFNKDIINFIKNKKLFFKILIASIPVMASGYFLLKTNLIESLRNIEVIGWATIIFGILLFISDKFKINKSIKRDLNYKSALFIGLFQILSLIPGVSRMGITITASRFQNFNRYDASKISFLLSIPVLGVITIYGLNNLITSGDLSVSILDFFSIFLAFIFSIFTIKFFLQYVRKFNLNIFVGYRLVLGMILLSITYL